MMICSLLCLSVQVASVRSLPTASDFFPTSVGLKRTYVEKGNDGETTTIDEVLPSVKYQGAQVFPVSTSSLGGKPLGMSFYRVNGTGVFLVANRLDEPFKDEIPLLLLDGNKKSWNLMLQLGSGERKDFLRIQGEATLNGSRDVLGKKVETCEVNIVVEAGGGKATQRDIQKAIYARGIGLVELKSSTSLGNRMVERVLKLTKLETAK